MKVDLMESRLRKYAKSRAEYGHACYKSTVLLLSASAATGMGAFISPPPAEAAIQYSGLKGLAMGTNVDIQRHGVDLDSDGIDDFTFDLIHYDFNFWGGFNRQEMEVDYFVLRSPTATNQVLHQENEAGTTFYPAHLPTNYTIQSQLHDPAVNKWDAGTLDLLAMRSHIYLRVFTSPGVMLEETHSGGNFIGKKGFLGVRFQISGRTHYGWIQFATEEDLKRGTIIDWAYEDEADKPIRAGEGRFNWGLFLPAIANGAKKNP